MRVDFLRLSGVAAVVVLAACGGQAGRGGVGSNSQVVVRLDAGTAGLEDATRVADQTCASRGGRARLLAVTTPPPFSAHLPPSTRVPEAVFACDAPLR